MSKTLNCPKCGDEISYLYEYCESEVRRKFAVDDKGNPIWIDWEMVDDSFPVIEYSCPECNGVICNDADVAIAFLRGEEIIPVEEPVLSTPDTKLYPVIQLSREEVAMAFAPEFRTEKMSKLTDDDVQRIASKVGDLLMNEYLYWEVLEMVASGWY